MMMITNIIMEIIVMFEEVVGKMREIRMGVVDSEAGGGSSSNGDDDEVEDEVDVRWR